jgi:DNA-binding NarL/FixJ family response regulator
MGEGWPFVGRAEELALIGQAIADPNASGLVVAGTSGVGKSRLAREALAKAERDGHPARMCVATHVMQEVPFGALAQLLPARLPTATDRVNLLRIAAEEVTAPVTGTRLVLGVDDAHLLDPLSAALIHHLVRGPGVFVLATVRTDEPVPDAITALWSGRIVERLDLLQLLPPDIEQLLAEHLGGPVDNLTVKRLIRASAGNALMLHELVAAGHRAGALRSVEGVWRWQGPWVLAPRLIQLIEQRIGALDDDEQEVLELLAYGEPLGAELLARLVSAKAVETLESRGLCRAEQQQRRVTVQLAHPLYGEVVRARTPLLRARRHQRRLADVLQETGARRSGDALRLATWRLASGGQSSPQLLMSAAWQAWSLLDLALTERIARTAYAAGARVDAVMLLGRILVLSDRNEEAIALLAEALSKAEDDQQRVELALLQAYAQFWGLDQTEQSIAAIDSAASGVTDAAARAGLNAMKAVMMAHTGRMSQASTIAGEVLAGQHTVGGNLLGATHMAIGIARTWQGQTEQAIASLDDALTTLGRGDDGPWFVVVAESWRCHALLNQGDLAAATVSAAAAYRRAADTGWDLAIGGSSIDQALACRAAGRLDEAMRWLRECLGLARAEHTSGYLMRSWVLAELAHTAALRGDGAEAERYLAEADACRRGSMAHYWPRLELARIWVTAAGSDRLETDRQAIAVADWLRDAGARLYEAIALYDAARLGAARKVHLRLHSLAEQLPSLLIRCGAAHADAIVERDGPQLERVSANLEAMGFVLLAAEAAADAAEAYRHAARADSARRATARASALARRCGQPATPSLRNLQAPQLTARQIEIAHLAAAGMTDEQIARQLGVSVRTVHNHLHQTYGKLGVHTRTELAGILAPHTSQH